MISAVVLTRNNATTLSITLSSLKFCDEILIIDNYSTDSTYKIAKKYKARFIKHRLNDDFASQRNFGLEKSSGEWVLFIDSDEVVSKSLASEIKHKVKDNNFNGFYIPRVDHWIGKKIKHGENKINLLRLARKGSGKWKRRVHEYWDIKGNLGILNNEITHYPHPNVSDFISTINDYSRLHSMENKKEGKASSLFKIILFPVLKFKRNFLLKSGYKDGVHGFVIAVIMSFHSFLSWSNLWLTSKKK